MKHPWDSQDFRSGATAAGCSKQLLDVAEMAARAIKHVNPDLPVLFTLKHLSHVTGVEWATLRSIVERRNDPYRVFRLKKRARPNGAAARPYRTICVPNPALMILQRWIAQNILNVVRPHHSSYAYAPHADLLGAAGKHAGCRWLVKMDVTSFFESINERAAYWVFKGLGYNALLSFEMSRLCTRLDPGGSQISRPSVGAMPYSLLSQGHLPQGAPTSPMLANLVVRRLDDALDSIAEVRGWAYTRYADDLAFSTCQRVTRETAVSISRLAERELTAYGLATNHHKTMIVPPGARKIVLGLLVDRDSPRLTKEFRDNIETHLYALTNLKIGTIKHQRSRGFVSIIGLRQHIQGLIAFAHHVDSEYARELRLKFERVDWTT